MNITSIHEQVSLKINTKKLTNSIQEGVRSAVFPGAQVGWIDKTGEKTLLAVGRESTSISPEITNETIYDTASLTKSLCTGLLAHWLVQQKKWRWDDLLITWLPEFRGDMAEKITLGNLISFGVPFDITLSHLKHLSADMLWNQILHAPINGVIGAQPAYLNTTSILLGRAIELTMGESLPESARRLFWEPIGMKNTGFFPHAGIIRVFSSDEHSGNTVRIAPTEIDDWRKEIKQKKLQLDSTSPHSLAEVRGEVHDESAWVLREKFAVGSAGMYSTAHDILLLIEEIFNVYQGKPSALPLNKKTIQSFSENVFFPDTTLLAKQSSHKKIGSRGWELNADWMGNTPAGTFGKTGFTGCSVAMNLEIGRAGIILSNTTYPKRPTDRTALTDIRREFYECLMG